MVQSKPTTPKRGYAQKTVEVSKSIHRGHREDKSLTTLSEVAYPGPSREVLEIINAHSSAGPQENQVTTDDVIKGFRDLGREMTASNMLTILLRALAKDETETLFDWLMWGRFNNGPQVNGKGNWEQLCSVIPNLDKSWHGLVETYEVVFCDCSEDTEEEDPVGPTVTWSTISPNSQRHVTPSSPVQPPSSPTASFARSGQSFSTLSPISQRRKRTTPEPSFEPAITFPKPLGENEMQEGSDGGLLQQPKKVKMPPAADLPTTD